MRSRFSAIISSVQSKEAPDRPCYGVSQTCPDVLRRRFRGFCTVFGFSLFGRVGVNPGISQWYRVGDAGALRAEPLATLCLARSSKELMSSCRPGRSSLSRPSAVAWLGSPRVARIYQCQNSRYLDTNSDYDTWGTSKKISIAESAAAVRAFNSLAM